MRVIINVDDLGLHPAVRRAVEELCEALPAVSTTLLANGPDAPRAAEAVLARRAKGLPCPGVGVHLNVLRGRPVSDPKDIPSLVGMDGLFFGSYATFARRLATGRIQIAEVEREWNRQVEAVKAMGITPTHVDSEKHTHALPGLFQAAARVARSHGIPWMRRPMERLALRPLPAKGAARVFFLRACSLSWGRVQGAAMPHTSWGIAEQADLLTPEHFLDYARRLPRDAVVEISCHPGRPEPKDPGLPPEFGNMRVAGQWEAELDRLLGADWAGKLDRAGVEITDFGRLDAAEAEA